MKVLNLQCSGLHTFEGWFASEQDFTLQCGRNLIACPVCGDVSVQKMLSAPRLNLSGAKEPSAQLVPKAVGVTPSIGTGSGVFPASSPDVQSALDQAWLQVVQRVVATTDDVGDRFAEEARRIHYGETQVRGIRGQATPEDARELVEEGIALVALPIPEHLKKPLH